MTNDQLLDTIGNANDQYLVETQYHRDGTAPPVQTRSLPCRRIWLIAAILAICLLLVGCTVAYMQGWFTDYFSEKSETPLSSEQIAYIEENEQVINEAQVQNGWTLELRSAMTDGSNAYVIIGVTAPEGTNLEPDNESDPRERFNAGNNSLWGSLEMQPDMVSNSTGIFAGSIDCSWQEDGDGLGHTKNMVIQIEPDRSSFSVDPFGSEVEWYIHIEDIIHQYDNKEYRQELMNGKYQGQTEVMFTYEESRKLWCHDVLTEGVWDFTINFSTNEAGTELLAEPISVTVDIWRKVGTELTDYAYVTEEVTIYSMVLRPLSLSIYYQDCNGSPSFADTEDHPAYAVMKDGSQIPLLPYGIAGTGYRALNAETPIVLSEVDHILLGDGTVIPVS